MQKPSVAFITFVAVLLVAACLYTEYYPVLTGRLEMSEAYYRLQRRRLVDAENSAQAAAAADTLSPEPWRLLAELRMARWQHSSDEKDWQRFIETADTFRHLNPRHHLAWLDRGHWFLAAWRKSQRAEDLQTAIEAYQKTVERYPNRALYHAQLAFVLDLAGRHDAARQEAEKALQLDRLMPHREQKLDRQHVADPQLVGGELKTYLDESAEQTAQRLRNAPAEDMR
jgi:tetratricopeptide (TPR) repeat protein